MNFRIILLFSLLAFISQPAMADNFFFSITGAPGMGGTTTGEIEGLQNNATSTPTDVIIFSQPSGYTFAPSDLLANGFSYYANDSVFTESNGVITGANTVLYRPINGNSFQAYGFDASEDGFTNANGIYQIVNGVATSNYNSNGFSGATYTPVPEPRTTGLLLLLGVAGIAVTRRLLSLRTI